MTHLPPVFIPWLDALLSDDADLIKNALAKLPDATLPDIALAALEIVWQLQEDEDLSAKVYEVLENEEGEGHLKKVADAFEIFRSVTEVLPWMDENSSELQQSNFAQFRKTKDRYEALLATHNYYTELYLNMARKLYMLFKLENEARLCFEGVLKYNDKNDEAYYALGRMEEKKQEFDTAVKFYESAVALNPQNIYAQLQLGALKANVLGLFEEAIEHYNKAIEQDPFSAEPYIRVAEAHYHLQQIDRTKQFLEIALSINEYHEEALNLLGTIYWKIENNYEKAIETYQKGLDHLLHGDSALLLGSLGDLYAHYLQDFDKARLYYEKSLKANPAQRNIIQQFIPILLRVFHDHAVIAEYYESYLKSEPLDTEIRIAYTNFLIEYLHDYELAQEQLQTVFHTTSENEEAQRLMSRISQYVAPTFTDDDADLTDDDEIYEVIYDDEDDEDEDDDDFAGGGAAGDS